MPHLHNGEHRGQANRSHCCQKTCQRPQGQGYTPCKSTVGVGGGPDQENAHGKTQLHLLVKCMKESRVKSKQWLLQSFSRMHTTKSIQAADEPAQVYSCADTGQLMDKWQCTAPPASPLSLLVNNDQDLQQSTITKDYSQQYLVGIVSELYFQ